MNTHYSAGLFFCLYFGHSKAQRTYIQNQRAHTNTYNWDCCVNINTFIGTKTEATAAAVYTHKTQQ